MVLFAIFKPDRKMVITQMDIPHFMLANRVNETKNISYFTCVLFEFAMNFRACLCLTAFDFLMISSKSVSISEMTNRNLV
jgi:hypothetical protein